MWWETGEHDQIGQKESDGIKKSRLFNKKTYWLKSE